MCLSGIYVNLQVNLHVTSYFNLNYIINIFNCLNKYLVVTREESERGGVMRKGALENEQFGIFLGFLFPELLLEGRVYFGGSFIHFIVC